MATENLVLYSDVPFSDLASFALAISDQGYRMVAKSEQNFLLQQARLESATHEFRLLNASLRLSPAWIINDMERMLEAMRKDPKLVYVSDTDETTILVAQSKCELLSIEEEYGTLYKAYVMRKGDQRLRNSVNRAADLARAIVERESLTQLSKKCLRQADYNADAKPLRLGRLHVVWTVFGGGIAISIAALLTEFALVRFI